MSFTKDFPIIINTLLYIVAFLYVVTKKRKFEIATFLFVIYMISAICSGLLYYDIFGYGELYNINLFPFIYLFISLIIAFAPIFRFESQNINHLVEPNKLFIVISIYLIVVIIANFLGNVQIIFSNIKSVIADTNFLNSIYREKIIIEAAKVGERELNYLAIFSNLATEMTLLFFFYNLTRIRKQRLLSWGLGIAAILPIFQVLITANRGKIGTTILGFIFLYLLFKPIMERSIKRKIKILIFVFASIAISIFSLITLARFAEGDKKINSAVLGSLVYYEGQSMLHFNEYALSENVRQYGDNSFPEIRAIIGLEYSKNIFDRQAKWGSKMGSIQGAFYTFIGDIVFDFGPIVSIMLIGIAAFIVRKKTKIMNHGYFHQIILLYIWYNICIQGVYYFTYKTIGGNLIIIFSLIVYAIFRIDHSLRRRYT